MPEAGTVRIPCPDELTDDMTRADIVEVLTHIRFVDGHAVVQLDRGDQFQAPSSNLIVATIPTAVTLPAAPSHTFPIAPSAARSAL